MAMPAKYASAQPGPSGESDGAGPSTTAEPRRNWFATLNGSHRWICGPTFGMSWTSSRPGSRSAPARWHRRSAGSSCRRDREDRGERVDRAGPGDAPFVGVLIPRSSFGRMSFAMPQDPKAVISPMTSASSATTIGLGQQRRRAVRHRLERGADRAEAVFGGDRQRGEHHDHDEAEGAAELGRGHGDRDVGAAGPRRPAGGEADRDGEGDRPCTTTASGW